MSQLGLFTGSNQLNLVNENSQNSVVWLHSVSLFTLTEPATVPERLSFGKKDSTWVVMIWDTPITDQNAPLTQYAIQYAWTAKRTVNGTSRVPSSMLSANITGLRPNYEYVFSVAAVNVAGVGNFTSFTTYTLEAGMTLLSKTHVQLDSL